MQPSGFRVEGRAAGRAAKLVQVWPSLAQVEQCGPKSPPEHAEGAGAGPKTDGAAGEMGGRVAGQAGGGRREAVLHPAGWRRKRLSRRK
jgi:hypothetical protein